jgi:hypothetical protein
MAEVAVMVLDAVPEGPMVTLGTLKVPAVYVILPFITQFAVLNADKSKVPDESVIKPVKVVAAELLLSVKPPLIVVVPVTENDPEFDIKTDEPVFDVRLPEIVKELFPLIVRVPDAIVTFPLNEVTEAFKLKIWSALKVMLPVPDLFNVPELEIPPLKTKGEVLAVLSEPPRSIVN